jgi:hypothetical protein
MDILIARLLHVGAGVIWAGTAITFAWYIEPTVNETGPSGQAFMQTLIRRGYSRFVTVVALTGIISGLYLYWRVSGGLQASWITSGPGLTLTLGGLSALVAFAFGPIFYGPAGKRMNEISQAIGPSGPTPDQRTELAAINHRLARVGVWSALLLGFTVLTMAGARYIDTILP